MIILQRLETIPYPISDYSNGGGASDADQLQHAPVIAPVIYCVLYERTL